MASRGGAFGAVACASALVVLAPSRALAEDQTGFEIGFRTGYSIALGKIEGGGNADLGDYVSGNLPLWLDLGYRATPNLMVGIWGLYGFGFIGGTLNDDGCQVNGVSCSAHDIRIGADVQYHLQPFQKVDPWLGLGFGYEWLSLDVSASALGVNADLGTDVHGFQFFDVQGGVDFLPVADTGFGVGPFIDFALGEYSDGSCSGSLSGLIQGSGSLGCDISNTALHEWLTLGVRGTFVP